MNIHRIRLRLLLLAETANATSGLTGMVFRSQERSDGEGASSIQQPASGIQHLASSNQTFVVLRHLFDGLVVEGDVVVGGVS